MAISDPETLKREKHRSKASVFSVVFLPTLACNCTCSHCFENLAGHRIDDHNYEMIFSKMRELAETVGCRILRVYWQGGEVLCLSPESIQKALDVSKSVFEGMDIKIEHHLQTNLLNYDTDTWKDVISSFTLGSISSSVDFPNVYRKTPTISEDEYLHAWLKKKEAAEKDGFTVSVISLPNPETLKLGAERFYKFYSDEIGIKNVQVNFPFPGGDDGLQSLDLDELAVFMIDLYEFWIASGRGLNLSPFQAMEDRLLRNKGSLACCWSYSCATSLICIGPKGDVGQCDCWVANFDDYNFGSIDQPFEEILNSDNRQLFLDRPLKLMNNTKCGECKFWKLCGGGCAVRAMTFTGDFFAPDHYCPVYYALFSAILDNNTGVEAQLDINVRNEEIYTEAIHDGRQDGR